MGQVVIKSASIKLALSDDLKSSASAMKSAIESIDNAIKETEKADAKVRADRALALKVQIKEAGVLEKAEKLSKDLGVDVGSVPGYKDADNAYNLLEAALKRASEY